MREEKPDEKKPDVQEPPKEDEDLPPPNRDIQEPEKGSTILTQADGKFADDFQDLNSV